MSETPYFLSTQAEILPYADPHASYVLDLRFADKLPLEWSAGLQHASITTRSISEYEQAGTIPQGFLNHAETGDQRIIEVAPGLAEFLPRFAQIASVRPTAIDVIDYGKLIEFLGESMPKLNTTQKQQAGMMIDRARTILELVDYIRSPVQIIKSRHPELQGKFDTVVYNPGTIKENSVALDLVAWLQKK